MKRASSRGKFTCLRVLLAKFTHSMGTVGLQRKITTCLFTSKIVQKTSYSVLNNLRFETYSNLKLRVQNLSSQVSLPAWTVGVYYALKFGNQELCSKKKKSRKYMKVQHL